MFSIGNVSRVNFAPTFPNANRNFLSVVVENRFVAERAIFALHRIEVYALRFHGVNHPFHLPLVILYHQSPGMSIGVAGSTIVKCFFVAVFEIVRLIYDFHFNVVLVFAAHITNVFNFGNAKRRSPL